MRPFALIDDPQAGTTLHFRKPKKLLCAHSFSEIDETLEQMVEAQQAGYHLTGYFAYEAGFHFEPRLRSIAPVPLAPLICFGVFDEPETVSLSDSLAGGSLAEIEPAWSAKHYEQRFKQVIAYILAGDVYQVNLTFPLRGKWDGDPLAVYSLLRRHQKARYGAMIAFGEDTILSWSPELFFETNGRNIRVRPMKGTAPRGSDLVDDDQQARLLSLSEKDRAENLMIVDLLRNDLGRVAELGSVKVTDLFTIERYPTVLQMTSGVEAHLREDIGLREILPALFPCGSVTGAPKIRAMEIIQELEDRPRGIYCGSIGHVRPNGDARFNVAIRTAKLSPGGNFVFNVGSGVVCDSEAQAEYRECLLKARFLEQAFQISA